MSRLVLASRSPRRKELLERLGLALEIAPAELDEAPRAGETPRRHVRRLAAGKAREAAKGLEGEGPAFVIGADTEVVVDGQVLGKPADLEDARRMLRLLSGRTHEVITGYAILPVTGQDPASRGLSGIVSTQVEFKALDEDEIDAYLATGEPMHKAGAYAIQGVGAFLVRRIRGSHSNVIGLPVCEVVEALRALGAITSPIGPDARPDEQ
jgi:septum formation protein